MKVWVALEDLLNLNFIDLDDIMLRRYQLFGAIGVEEFLMLLISVFIDSQGW